MVWKINQVSNLFIHSFIFDKQKKAMGFHFFASWIKGFVGCVFCVLGFLCVVGVWKKKIEKR